MEIIRDGKKIILTREEIAEAHKVFVTDWMTGVAINDFGIKAEDAEVVANLAYDTYCNIEGISEYDAVELEAFKYKKNAGGKNAD